MEGLLTKVIKMRRIVFDGTDDKFQTLISLIDDNKLDEIVKMVKKSKVHSGRCFFLSGKKDLVSVSGRNGMTALHHACLHARHQIVKYLLEQVFTCTNFAEMLRMLIQMWWTAKAQMLFITVAEPHRVTLIMC